MRFQRSGLEWPSATAGIARQRARQLRLVMGKPGRIGDARQPRQFGEQPLGDLVRVVQRVFPALERGRAKGRAPPPASLPRSGAA